MVKTWLSPGLSLFVPSGQPSPSRATPTLHLPITSHTLIRRTPNAKRSFHSELEVEFPATIRPGMLHPELQVSQLSHHRIDHHRNHLTFRKSFDCGQQHL